VDGSGQIGITANAVLPAVKRNGLKEE